MARWLLAVAAVPLAVLLLLVLDTSRFWISNVNAASPQPQPQQQQQYRHGRGAPPMASTKPPVSRQPQRAGKRPWPQWSHFSSLKDTFKKPKLPSLSSPFTHSKCTAAAPAKHAARPGDTALSSSKRSLAWKALLLLNSAAILYTGYFIAHIWFYLGCFLSDNGRLAPFHSIHTVSSLVGAMLFFAGGIVGCWTGHWMFVLMPMLLWFGIILLAISNLN